jgi:hypothetical protein
MLRGKFRFLLAAAVVVVGLGAGAVAIAGSGDQPQTQAVDGEFSASPVRVHLETCVGADGTYLEIRGRFAGTIVSSNPSLTGTLEFTAEPALINTSTGLGTFRGHFSIRSAATGKQTATGEFNTVVTEGSLNHGMALGTFVDVGGSFDFVANFKSTVDNGLNVQGQFGGTFADNRIPAVVQRGQCPGPVTTVP